MNYKIWDIIHVIIYLFVIIYFNKNLSQNTEVVYLIYTMPSRGNIQPEKVISK